MCLEPGDPFFTSLPVIQVFVDFLEKVAEKYAFRAIYCFIPEHLHLIILGRSGDSDVLRGVERFKQLTGYWLRANHPSTKWEKSFHDRIIRAPELGIKVRYVLDNPVRWGLVNHWREYPFTGAIGLDLEIFLEELAPD